MTIPRILIIYLSLYFINFYDISVSLNICHRSFHGIKPCNTFLKTDSVVGGCQFFT